MTSSPATILTAFFEDEDDIRHDKEFVILDPGGIQPGTRIVAGHPGAQGSFLEIISNEDQYIWQAQWHDRTGVGAHDGKLFRIILLPPIEYQDGLAVRRQFKVELIGDHELPSPWSY